MEIKLEALTKDYREQFILDNQKVFKYGAIEEFGLRDDHFEENDQIISRRVIEESMNSKNAKTFRIIADEKYVGGVILLINPNHRNELLLLYTLSEIHNKGIGQATWKEVEKMFPETEVWETNTPYFEKRNIHFYVNKLGFNIVEYYNEYHKNQNEDNNDMFRFEKSMMK